MSDTHTDATDVDKWYRGSTKGDGDGAAGLDVCRLV